MGDDGHTVSKISIRTTARGLLLMAFFTILWATQAYNGLRNSYARFILIIFPILSLVFVVCAIKLIKTARSYSKRSSETDAAEQKRMKKWFGIIFGAEILAIIIAINAFIKLGRPDLILPVIALIAGLHFYPLAKIFKRTIDYYMATWSTVIATIALIFTLDKTVTQNMLFVFLGIGMAITTSCYGIYMIRKSTF